MRSPFTYTVDPQTAWWGGNELRQYAAPITYGCFYPKESGVEAVLA